jgi:hypothetical protein
VHFLALSLIAYPALSTQGCLEKKGKMDRKRRKETKIRKALGEIASLHGELLLVDAIDLFT